MLTWDRSRSLRNAGLLLGLLVVPLLLVGCPQLLSDDFKVVSAMPSGGSGETGHVLDAGASGELSAAGAGQTGGSSSLGTGAISTVAGSTSFETGPILSGGVQAITTGGTASGGSIGASESTSVAGGMSSVTTSVRIGGLLDCNQPVELTSASNNGQVVASFDELRTSTDITGNTFGFRSSNTVVAHGKVSAYDDGTGKYSLTLVSDGNGGLAVRGYNGEASRWGGGVEFDIDCTNAATRTGLTFRSKGSSPSGMATVSLVLTNGDVVEDAFWASASWTKYQVPFSEFAGSDDSPSAKTTGGGLTQICFGAQLTWNNGAAYTGSYELIIDDLGFY